MVYLPAWGEWIEIYIMAVYAEACGISPHGENGLKFRDPYGDENRCGISPHGESGLKLGSYAAAR